TPYQADYKFLTTIAAKTPRSRDRNIFAYKGQLTAYGSLNGVIFLAKACHIIQANATLRPCSAQN
ncbi:MAG TPA: hypothetical protein VM912_20005, partial [Terriglobales bacterium]|nr:hypothetical protein [Terriglobales bacterium]